MAEIPSDILGAIKAAAKETWPGDRDMQNYYIESETTGYAAFLEIEFGSALPFKDQIIEWANEFNETWEERASFIADEVDAFIDLRERSEDVPADVLDELKRKAAAENEYFSSQRDEVERGIQQFRYVRDTRAKVVPIRDLLTRMEDIIASECYNGNIQNYGPGGLWEGEGRSFRYPTTFLCGDEKVKRRGRSDDLKPEELLTGAYKFGANELSIFRALVKIVDMLESDYNLKVPRA